MIGIFNRFKAGQPFAALTADWLNRVANFINLLTVRGEGCEVTIVKPADPSESNPPIITIRVTGAGLTQQDVEQIATGVVNALIKPYASTPPAITAAGSAGTVAEYARGNHTHAAGGTLETFVTGVQFNASARTLTLTYKQGYIVTGGSSGTTIVDNLVAHS